LNINRTVYFGSMVVPFKKAGFDHKRNTANVVRIAAEAMGGKGGGPDMAQAGGPEGAKAELAIAAVRSAIHS
jgi:alanyl-tRNA synthetase